MKKTLTVFTVLLLVSAIGFTTAYGYGGGRSGSKRNVPTQSSLAAQGAVLGASTYSFGANLSQGASSDAVKELQERLRAEGFFTFHTSTGFFGPITLEAVKAYQAAKGIPATGFVGPLTRAELNK